MIRGVRLIIRSATAVSPSRSMAVESRRRPAAGQDTAANLKRLLKPGTEVSFDIVKSAQALD